MPRPSVERERTTVSLLPKTHASLHRLARESGMTKSDVINRAVELYDFVTGRLDAGTELWLRDPAADKYTQLQIL